MASLLVKRLFALKGMIAEPVYYCNSIRVVFRYENGTRTDEVQGHKYLVTNTDTFEQIEVFIAGSTPLLHQRDWKNCKKQEKESLWSLRTQL